MSRETIFHSKKKPASRQALFLLLNIRKFQSVSFLLVFLLEKEAEHKGQHAEGCEDYHRNQLTAGCFAQVPDQHRHEAEAYVLYPEDQAVGASQDFLVNNLRN